MHARMRHSNRNEVNAALPDVPPRPHGPIPKTAISVVPNCVHSAVSRRVYEVAWKKYSQSWTGRG